MMPSFSEEWFDVVDAEDRVVGKALRREVHEKRLMHRSIHIMVFNPEGHLYLQKRVLTKDENPGMWDTSVSGHVDSGEDYETSAHRELMEELGISENLEHCGKLTAGPQTAMEHVCVYHCETVKPITINLQEISEGRYWTLDEIQEALNVNPDIFTPTFRLIFSQYPVP